MSVTRVRHLRQEVADRTGAEHGDVPAVHPAGPGHRVDADGDRLDERALLQGERGGKRDDLRGLGDEQVLRAAGGLEAAHRERIADVVVAAPAWPARSADSLWGGRDEVAHPDAGDVRADRLDHRRELMALHDRIRGEGVLAVVHVNVRSAHADAPHAEQDLPGPGRRRGRLAEFDHTWRRHRGLSHRQPPGGVCLDVRPQPRLTLYDNGYRVQVSDSTRSPESTSGLEWESTAE